MSVIRRLRGTSGTSLIEILITLGIFVTGLTYVLRVFPAGFVSLKHDENLTMANRLAQSELERLQGRSENLPSGIVPWGWTGTKYDILPKTDPADMQDQTTMGSFPSPFNMHYFTDVNKFRRIVGEYTRIPSPASMDLIGPGSIYVLQFSPIMTTDSITVSGGAMRRRWMGANAAIPKLNNFGMYAIDYDGAMLYLKPSTDPRMFVIGYSYWVASGGAPSLRTVAGIEINVPSATSVQMSQGYVAIPIPDGLGGLLSSVTGFQEIDRASDTVARGFVMLAGGAWSAVDPYQFKVVDPFAGVIAFNPLAYGYDEYTARGRQPLVANIDYSMLDWHIIREERRIPETITSDADRDAKLTLPFIKQTGESQEFDGRIYEGMAPDYGITADVMAVDIETGQWYTPGSPGPNGTGLAMEVNYRNGTIRFHPGFAGKTMRIYYCAEGDWAVQTYKAYDVFQRSYTPGVDHRQYRLVDDTKLEFMGCAAGRTIAVDFAYRVRTGGNTTSPEIFSSGQVYRLSDAIDPVTDCVSTDLMSELRSSYPNGTLFDITRVNKVYGVSLGVRVVWRESGRGLSTSGRWRKTGLETYLTRPAN